MDSKNKTKFQICNKILRKKNYFKYNSLYNKD